MAVFRSRPGVRARIASQPGPNAVFKRCATPRHQPFDPRESHAAQGADFANNTQVLGGIIWSSPTFTPFRWNPSWVGFGCAYPLGKQQANAPDNWHDHAPSAVPFRWSAMTHPSSRILVGDSANWGAEATGTAPPFTGENGAYL